MKDLVVYATGGQYYDECRKYFDHTKEDIKNVREFAAKHGIAADDYAYAHHVLYVKVTPDTRKFEQLAKKSTVIWDDAEYYAIKGNSKLGQEFNKFYDSLYSDREPEPSLALFQFVHRIRYVQFFYDGKLYIEAHASGDLNIPKDFQQMKLSAYYEMMEDIKENHRQGVEPI